MGAEIKYPHTGEVQVVRYSESKQIPGGTVYGTKDGCIVLRNNPIGGNYPLEDRHEYLKDDYPVAYANGEVLLKPRLDRDLNNFVSPLSDGQEGAQ